MSILHVVARELRCFLVRRLVALNIIFESSICAIPDEKKSQKLARLIVMAGNPP
jgi:hypothetical protein